MPFGSAQGVGVFFVVDDLVFVADGLASFFFEDEVFDAAVGAGCHSPFESKVKFFVAIFCDDAAASALGDVFEGVVFHNPAYFGKFFF